MEVIPAIDLKDGLCVRLYQGDFTQQQTFSTDPVGVALEWELQGARRLHIVDLDGAASGNAANQEVIRQIKERLKIPIQVGGGIRNLEAVDQVLSMGVDRAILGTAAVENPILVEHSLAQFGKESIVVSVDAREGMVSTRGWTRGSSIAVLELVKRMADLGVARFIYTDISRDGTMTEPNLQGISSVIRSSPVPIIASGGVACIKHLTDLVELGLEGAIVGRALYTGAVNLPEAIADVRRATQI